MDKLSAKIEDAARIISEAYSATDKPVVMFSSGKDSTAMLHLMKFKLGLDFPVLFHREPFFHAKYAFGMALLAAWQCTAYDYVPVAVDMWEGKDIMAWTNHYQIGKHEEKTVTLALPKNIIEPEEGKPYLCGKLDIFGRPLGAFEYPWTIAFLGHKNTDEDQIAGKVPLKVDILDNGFGPRAGFPLRNWTDEDVWNYLDQNKLPVQADRYDRIARSEKPDKSPNGDYFHACIACCDRRNGPMVHCPKLGRDIENISSQIVYRDLKMNYIGSDT